MTKRLIMTIQVNMEKANGNNDNSRWTWRRQHKFTVIKNFVISLPSQPFLGRHLGFHKLFLQLGCSGLVCTLEFSLRYLLCMWCLWILWASTIFLLVKIVANIVTYSVQYFVYHLYIWCGIWCWIYISRAGFIYLMLDLYISDAGFLVQYLLNQWQCL